MIYIKCPSCNKLLGDIQQEYEQKLLIIDNNDKLTKKEKDQKKIDLVNSFYLTRYCCRSRLLGYIVNLVEKLI